MCSFREATRSPFYKQVDRALAERGQHLGLTLTTGGDDRDDESAERLNEMKAEMDVSTCSTKNHFFDAFQSVHACKPRTRSTAALVMMLFVMSAVYTSVETVKLAIQEERQFRTRWNALCTRECAKLAHLDAVYKR